MVRLSSPRSPRFYSHGCAAGDQVVRMIAEICNAREGLRERLLLTSRWCRPLHLARSLGFSTSAYVPDSYTLLHLHTTHSHTHLTLHHRYNPQYTHFPHHNHNTRTIVTAEDRCEAEIVRFVLLHEIGLLRIVQAVFGVRFVAGGGLVQAIPMRSGRTHPLPLLLCCQSRRGLMLAPSLPIGQTRVRECSARCRAAGLLLGRERRGHTEPTAGSPCGRHHHRPPRARCGPTRRARPSPPSARSTRASPAL